MRFPLLRRLSHLIHRRARSESFAGITPIAPLDALTRSYSLNNLGEQARTPTIDPAIHQIVIPAPHALRTPPRSPIVTYTPATPGMHPYKLASVNQRILELEHELGQLKAENAHLKEANDALKFDTELLQEQLRFLEHSERPLSSDVRLITKEALEILKTQARRCGEMDRFVRTIIDLGLKTEEPIFPVVHKAIIAGETHDEAVVLAIREAAARPGSPWATIIPAVIGSRTNEQYLSALNMTLQSRRENKELQTVKKFWKGVAKDDPANADLVTPSSSNLSAVQVVLSEKRQRAVDDLLGKLRNGTVPVRSQVISQSSAGASSVMPSSSLAFSTISSQDLDDDHRTASDHSISPDVSTTLPYLRESSVPALPPLASQKFKEALIASHSSERFSIATTYKHVLGNRDLNTPTAALEASEEKPIEAVYTLPEFPRDFSGSSDLDFFSPATTLSAASSSDDSSRHVERGSLKALEEAEEEAEQEEQEESTSDDAEMANATLVNDTFYEILQSPSPKKSLLPVMKKARRFSLTPSTPTKPSPGKTPLPRDRPCSPALSTSKRRPATVAKTPSSPAKPRVQAPPSPSPSSLRKPTISSMRKSQPLASHSVTKETSPLRIKKREKATKRISPMKRLSRMVNGS